MSKWYEFTQNNTGGSFDVDNEICHRLFIEADCEAEAEEIAFDMGVYYNGVEDGGDCPCCGDRWYSPDEIVFPVKWGEKTFTTPEQYAQMLADEYGWTTPDARIFYKAGRVVDVFRPKDQPF